jgi:predicted RNase H-like HicB family nuclease
MAAMKKLQGRLSSAPKRAFKRADMKSKRTDVKSEMDRIINNRVARELAKRRRRRLPIETEREEDGRWIGEVPDLPGVLAYGETEAEARVKATALALHVIADRIEHGDPVPAEVSSLFVPA